MVQMFLVLELEGQVFDVVKGNWVDYIVFVWFCFYFRFLCVDCLIGIWLLFLLCLMGLLLVIFSDNILMLYDFWIVVVCFVGVFLMCGVGCMWNDIIDCNFDG